MSMGGKLLAEFLILCKLIDKWILIFESIRGVCYIIVLELILPIRVVLQFTMHLRIDLIYSFHFFLVT